MNKNSKLKRILVGVMTVSMVAGSLNTYQLPLRVVRAETTQSTEEVYTDSNGVKWGVEIVNDQVENIYPTKDNTSLKEVTYPSEIVLNGKKYTVAKIKNYKTKSELVNLQKIVIPKTIKEIGIGCFQYANNIKEVEIQSAYKIDERAFYMCDSLEKVTIKNQGGPMLIGVSAFYNCNNLKNVTIDCSDLTLDKCAFSTCTNLSSFYCTGNIKFCENAFINAFSANGVDGKFVTDGTIKLADSELSENRANYTNSKSYDLVRYPITVEVPVFKDCKNLRTIQIGKKGYNTSDASILWCSAFTGISRIDNLEINTPLKYTGYYANFKANSVGNVELNGDYIFNSDCNCYGSVRSDYLIDSESAVDSITINSKEVNLDTGLIRGKCSKLKFGKGVEEVAGNIVNYDDRLENRTFGLGSVTILNPKIIVNNKFNAKIGYGNTEKLYVAVDTMSNNQKQEQYTESIYDVGYNLSAPKNSYSNAVIALDASVDESKLEVDKSLQELDCCKVTAKYWDGTSDIINITDKSSGEGAICTDITKPLIAGKLDLSFKYADIIAKLSLNVKDTKVDHIEVNANKTKYYDGESINLNDFNVIAINKDGTKREVTNLEVTSSTGDNTIATYTNGSMTLTFKDLSSDKTASIELSIGQKQEFIAVYTGLPMISGGVLDMSNVRCAYKYSNGVTKDIENAKATSDVAEITEQDFNNVKVVNGQYIVYRYVEITDGLGENTTVNVPVVITGSMLDKLLSQTGQKPTETPVPTEPTIIVPIPTTDVPVTTSPANSSSPIIPSNVPIVTSPASSNTPVTPVPTNSNVPANPSATSDVVTGPSVTSGASDEYIRVNGLLSQSIEQDIEVINVDTKRIVGNRVNVGSSASIVVYLPSGLSLDNKDNGKMLYNTVINKNESARVDMSNVMYIEYQLVRLGSKYDNTNWSRMSSSISLGEKDGAYTLYLKATAVDGSTIIVRTNGYVIDSSSPEVEGIANSKTVKSLESIRVKDNFDIKIINLKKDGTIIVEKNKDTLNIDKDAQLVDENGEFILNYKFKSGKYELLLEDYAGRNKKIYFTVDSSGPKITGVKNKGIYKKSVKISFTDESGILSAQLNGKNIKSKVITKEGKYTLKVVDNLGNETIKTFIIDKKSPTIKGVTNKKKYRKAVTIKVSDKYGIKSVKLNKKTLKLSKTYKIKKKGTYTLVVTDKAGNSKKVKFSIK